MAASSAAEMKEHRDEEHQHRVAKEAAAERRWEQEQETQKQDRIDERLRRELADEKARVRKEERDADRDERRAAAAEAKEVRDHEYRMLLPQVKKGSAGN